MSIKRLWILVLAAAVPISGPVAHAQEEINDRFFSDKIGEAEAEGEEPEETLFQGSLTASTFVYRESGGPGDDGITDNASPISRLFTDVRAQIDAKHISGGSWDLRLDSRVRLSNACDLVSGNNLALFGPCRTQSGLYGDNEYDVREAYIQKTGQSFDLRLGRQYVLELAATKIDGLRFDYQSGQRLSFVGFAGLYPARGSRSLSDDYPAQVLGGVEGNKRIMPVAGGFGAAYRFQSAYGSVGGVGILPMAEETLGANEALRVFATSNGYWRQSKKLDFYHFAVLDLQGSGGTGLTNLSVGANYRPSGTLRVNAAFNRVDTETLNVIAQNRLEEPGVANAGVIQNNINVTRIASDSVRLGVTAAFRQQRFEVSASGQLRQRPEVAITAPDGMTAMTFEASQAAEVLLSVVDRRSYKNFRLGASVLRIFGVGGETYARSQSTLLRVHGSREFSGGKGQYELDVSYLASNDTSTAGCANRAIDPLNCFGATSVGTIGVGGMAHYRLKSNWLGVASVSAARQGFSTNEIDGPVSQANLLLSAFLRIAYRF